MPETRRPVKSAGLVGAIWNQMYPNGWRWENLTSGEASEERAKIEPVLEAIDALGFDLVKREEAADGRA